MGETLGDLGEFGLISRLLERVPVRGDAVVVGPGADDAAVVQVGDRSLIATADLSIEGRHFDRRFSSPSDIGWKALTVNVSDIAAMGGRPLWALLSIGAPADTAVEVLEQLYDGIAEAARAQGVLIIGGDTVGADVLVVSVALLGEPGSAGPVTRGGAHEGDLLCVTGALGAAAAGLALLRSGEDGDGEARALLARFPGLAEAHRRPIARVREGRAAAEAGARAMIDVSDGFSQDARHLHEASRIGGGLDPDAVPRAEGVVEADAWMHARDPVHRSFALNGGDDYELIMAVPPEVLEAVTAAVAPTALTVVGGFEFVQLALEEDGGGWDSFKGPR